MLTEDEYKFYMLEAFKVSQASTCSRRRVGAVIVNPNIKQIISTGWNHTVHKEGTCEQKFFDLFLESKQAEFASTTSMEAHVKDIQTFREALSKSPDMAHKMECSIDLIARLYHEEFYEWKETQEFKDIHWNYMDSEIHSEMHAIINALNHGVEIANCILFSSRSPCIDCAKAIIASGITEVAYNELSLKGQSGGLQLLEQNISLKHIDVSHRFRT